MKEDNGDRPRMTHDEMVAQIAAQMREGILDRDVVIASIYVFTHEFRSVMEAMSSGKMGGIMGRLIGRAAGNADD